MSRSFALLLTLALLSPAIGRAERPASGLLARLAKRADEVTREREQTLAARIEALLLALPEVARATVQVKLAEPAETPLDAPLAKPAVVLVLTLRGRGPSDDELRTLISRLIPEASVSTVRRATEAPRHALAELGPFRVESSSLTALRLTFVALLTSNALLALLVLVRARRHRPREPKVDRGGRTRDSP